MTQQLVTTSGGWHDLLAALPFPATCDCIGQRAFEIQISRVRTARVLFRYGMEKRRVNSFWSAHVLSYTTNEYEGVQSQCMHLHVVSLGQGQPFCI